MQGGTTTDSSEESVANAGGAGQNIIIGLTSAAGALEAGQENLKLLSSNL